MRAIVLAGGKGTRLRPYTTVLPKPLMPVGDHPILEIVVLQLRRDGFGEITFAVGHLAGLIEAYFRDGSQLGVSIGYSLEDEPMGTAGPIGLVTPPDDDFLVMNGDILTTISYAKLMQHHRSSGNAATIATYKKAVPVTLGVLEVDGDGYVTDYIEKPTLYYSVSTGVYCFNPRVLEAIPEKEFFDLPDLIRTLIKSGERVGTFEFEGYWLDIGRPEDYETAMQEFSAEVFI